MAKRVSDTERITAFFMESDLSVADTALKTATAIVNSRKKAEVNGKKPVSTASSPVVNGTAPEKTPRTRTSRKAAAAAAEAGTGTPAVTAPSTTAPADSGGDSIEDL